MLPIMVVRTCSPMNYCHYDPPVHIVHHQHVFPHEPCKKAIILPFILPNACLRCCLEKGLTAVCWALKFHHGLSIYLSCNAHFSLPSYQLYPWHTINWNEMISKPEKQRSNSIEIFVWWNCWAFLGCSVQHLVFAFWASTHPAFLSQVLRHLSLLPPDKYNNSMDSCRAPSFLLSLFWSTSSYSVSPAKNVRNKLFWSSAWYSTSRH